MNSSFYISIDNPPDGNCAFYAFAVALIAKMQKELKTGFNSPLLDKIIDQSVSKKQVETFIDHIKNYDFHQYTASNAEFLYWFNKILRKKVYRLYCNEFNKGPFASDIFMDIESLFNYWYQVKKGKISLDEENDEKNNDFYVDNKINDEMQNMVEVFIKTSEDKINFECQQKLEEERLIIEEGIKQQIAIELKRRLVVKLQAVNLKPDSIEYHTQFEKIKEDLLQSITKEVTEKAYNSANFRIQNQVEDSYIKKFILQNFFDLDLDELSDIQNNREIFLKKDCLVNDFLRRKFQQFSQVLNINAWGSTRDINQLANHFGIHVVYLSSEIPSDEFADSYIKNANEPVFYFKNSSGIHWTTVFKFDQKYQDGEDFALIKSIIDERLLNTDFNLTTSEISRLLQRYVDSTKSTNNLLTNTFKRALRFFKEPSDSFNSKVKTNTTEITNDCFDILDKSDLIEDVLADINSLVISKDDYLDKGFLQLIRYFNTRYERSHYGRKEVFKLPKEELEGLQLLR